MLIFNIIISPTVQFCVWRLLFDNTTASSQHFGCNESFSLNSCFIYPLRRNEDNPLLTDNHSNGVWDNLIKHLNLVYICCIKIMYNYTSFWILLFKQQVCNVDIKVKISENDFRCEMKINYPTTAQIRLIIIIVSSLICRCLWGSRALVGCVSRAERGRRPRCTYQSFLAKALAGLHCTAPIYREWEGLHSLIPKPCSLGMGLIPMYTYKVGIYIQWLYNYIYQNENDWREEAPKSCSKVARGHCKAPMYMIVCAHGEDSPIENTIEMRTLLVRSSEKWEHYWYILCTWLYTWL